jgi:hypothetical protein
VIFQYVFVQRGDYNFLPGMLIFQVFLISSGTSAAASMAIFRAFSRLSLPIGFGDLCWPGD